MNKFYSALIAIMVLVLTANSAFGDGTYVKGPALIEGTTTTVTVAGTTTLTKDSQTLQQFTGTTTQTVTLPNATTLPNGRKIYLFNRSTGAVTINYFGGALAQSLTEGQWVIATLYNNGTAAGTWDLAFSTGSASSAITALTGDVTATGPGVVSAVIPAGTINNTRMANVPTATFKGRVTAGTGVPEDLTGTQATTLLDTFTSSLKGLAPASGGGTGNFLRADGTWAPPGGAAGFTIGATILSGTANRIIYEDAGNQIAEDADLTFDGTSLSLGGPLELTTGKITKGGINYLHRTGTNNFFSGEGSGALITSGADNACHGALSCANQTTANHISALGYGAGYLNVGGSDNVHVGWLAGLSGTSAARMVNLGSGAGGAAVTTTDTINIGYNAGQSSTGGKTIAIGSSAAAANTTNGFTAVGHESGNAHTSGIRDSYYGYQSGRGATTATDQSFFGDSAGKVSNGSFGSYFGSLAGTAETSGFSNSGFGYASLLSLTTGNSNNCHGVNCLFTNSIGNFNNVMGTNAGYFVTGDGNSLFGNISGTAISSGTYNTCLGYGSCSTTTTGSDSIMIGHNINASSPTASNELAIGNFITGDASVIRFPSRPLILSQVATPSNPSAGTDAIYFKSDDILYQKNSAGTEVQVKSPIIASPTSTTAWTSGGGYTIQDGINNLVLDFAQTFSPTTLTMPSAPTDGMELCVVAGTTNSYSHNYVANAGQTLNGGGLLTLFNDTEICWTYKLSLTTWFRTEYAVPPLRTSSVIGSAPAAAGYTLSFSGSNNATLTLQPASGTFGGVLSSSAVNQVIGGTKNWKGAMSINTGSNTFTAPNYLVDIVGGAGNSTLQMRNDVSGTTSTDGVVTDFDGVNINTTNYEGNIKFTPLNGDSLEVLTGGLLVTTATLGSVTVNVGDATASYLSLSNTTATAEVTLQGTGELDLLQNGNFPVRILTNAIDQWHVSEFGQLQSQVAGNGISIKEGTDARQDFFTLVAGTLTVSNATITADTRIYCHAQDDNGGTPGFLRVSTRTVGTDYTVTSGSVLDTSTVACLLVEGI